MDAPAYVLRYAEGRCERVDSASGVSEQGKLVDLEHLAYSEHIIYLWSAGSARSMRG